MTAITCDALIVGGGVAGLFALDALRARGLSALLIELTALGSGQTTASQGILHAGVKYALAGAVGDDAGEVSRAAALWKERLCEPSGDLASVKKLANSCFLWRTAGVRGMVGMAAAAYALESRPLPVAASDRPRWLDEVAGDVMKLPETVIDPRSLLDVLARRHIGQLARGRVAHVMRVGELLQIEIEACVPMTVRCRELILAAGSGNEQLSRLAGEPLSMQRRPLRQAFVRGALPMVFGHCIDGAKTRITVTSEQLNGGEVVWNVGGELAERGASMDAHEFAQHARSEIEGAVRGLSLSGFEFASHLVDRAEPQTQSGRRPPRAFAHSAHGVTTLWPVKLVLAPGIADEIAEKVAGRVAGEGTAPIAWPSTIERLALADRPWQSAQWSLLS